MIITQVHIYTLELEDRVIHVLTLLELTTHNNENLGEELSDFFDNYIPTQNSDDILQTSLDCIQPSMKELESAGYESINYTGTHF